MTLIAPRWRLWSRRRAAETTRPVRPTPAAPSNQTVATEPMPRLTDIVHSVTATFGGSGWTLRFGSSGRAAVVSRLAEAEAAARALVAAGLGLPATSVRIRIVPDRDTVTALRRTASRRPWWRGGPDEV